MPRTLSTDPAKRRLQLFQNLYTNYYHWAALVEDQQLAWITVEGEEISFWDLLVGFELLPPRQKEAFRLHVLLGYTEAEAHARMNFSSNYTTLVGQYASAALKSMVRAYDNAALTRRRTRVASRVARHGVVSAEIQPPGYS